MANITTTEKNLLLDHALGVAEYTFGTTVYLGLFTADPTADGLLTAECTGANYARQAIDFDGAGSGTCDNTDQEAFTELATAEAWGTPTHWGICTTSTAGRMKFYGTITPAMSLTAGMQFVIAAGALDFTVT